MIKQGCLSRQMMLQQGDTIWLYNMQHTHRPEQGGINPPPFYSF